MAFSASLFLKTILYKENAKNVMGHNLLKLFKKLPTHIQENIKSNVVITNDNASFEKILNDISEVFEYERYYNEKIGSVVNVDFLLKLAIKLEEYCRINIINKMESVKNFV